MTEQDKRIKKVDDTREANLRWQEVRRTQLGHVVNIVLTFSTASLGFGVKLIVDNPSLAVNSALFDALIVLIFAILAGLLANYSRLWDFRYTSMAARGRWLEAREDAGEWLSSEQKENARRRHEFSGRAECRGRSTWCLLRLQLLIFIVGIALLVCGIWHSSRPLPWNDKAMATEYVNLTISPTGSAYNSFEANYFVTNMSGMDYHLSKSNIVMVKVPGSSGLRESPDVAIAQDFFIPAKQKVRVSFRLPLHKGDAFDEAVTKNNLVEIRKLLLKELQDVDGFVVFDPSAKYQISFNNGWKMGSEEEPR